MNGCSERPRDGIVPRMDLSFSAEELAFRDEVRAWIADAMSSPDASRFCAAFVCAAWKKSAALMASVAMIITWPPMISSSGEHAISR